MTAPGASAEATLEVEAGGRAPTPARWAPRTMRDEIHAMRAVKRAAASPPADPSARDVALADGKGVLVTPRESHDSTGRIIRAGFSARQRRLTVRDDDESDNPLVRCGCGRVTQADMLLDVRALPLALRGDMDFACDGCHSKWIRQGKITHEGLARALGAPAEVIEKQARRDALLRGDVV